jgi:hypothetical protein
VTRRHDVLWSADSLGTAGVRVQMLRWAVTHVTIIRTVFHSLGARSVPLILRRGSSLKRRRHVNVKQRVAVSARDACACACACDVCSRDVIR